MSGRRLAGVGAGLTAVALLVTGCASAQPGSAALVGEVAITESTIGDQLRSINEAIGQPPEAPNASLTRSIVSYNVGYELVAQTADSVAAAVAPGDLDRVYAQQVESFGSEADLLAAAAQQGIPPTVVRRDLETQLLIQEIVGKVAPGVTDPQQQQAALIDTLAMVATTNGVQIAPKYGEWDAETLQLGPLSHPVSRLAGSSTEALTSP